MKVIGITGGIGSGKTTVCKLFECLNVPIFYADDVAKQLMNSDEQVVNQVIRVFGDEAYTSNSLNRPYLASIVFNQPDKLKQLNSIVHPAVARATEEWKRRYEDAAYGLKEAAILFESGSYRFVERVISIWAPKAVRIARVVRRDAVEPAAVEQRINNQISESLRLSLSDFVIENDGNQLLIPQVIRLNTILKSL